MAPLDKSVKVGGAAKKKLYAPAKKMDKKKKAKKDEFYPNSPFDAERRRLENSAHQTRANIIKDYSENPDYSVTLGSNYLHDTFRKSITGGEESKGEGYEIFTKFKKCLSPAHCFGAKYSLRDVPQSILFENNTRERFKSGLGHFLSLDYSYFKEGLGVRWLNLRVTPSLKFGWLGFNTTQYKWGENYPNYTDKTQRSHTLFTVTPGATVDLTAQHEINRNLLLQGMVQLSGRGMFRFGDNAGIVKQIGQDEKKPEDREDAKYNKDPLWSYSVHGSVSLLVPALRISKGLTLYNARVGIGGMLFDDDIDRSGSGMWPLEGGVPDARGAFVIDAGADIPLNKDWMMSIYTRHKVGDGNGSHGGKINIFNQKYNAGVEAAVSHSWYKGEKEETKSTQAGISLIKRW